MTPAFPVHFSLMVNGKRQNACLETILDGAAYNVFSIHFADGFHDCFFDNGDGNIRGINESKSKPYAAALKHDLYIFNHLVAGTSLENFPYEVDGQFANGWILKKQGATGLVYRVYLKGQHKFDIVEKEKGWTAVSSDSGPIDTKLANYAFSWANTIIPEKREEEEPAEAIKPAKPIEFPLEFIFEGQAIAAYAMLMETRPWPQCTVVLIGPDPKANAFTFYKIDNKDQLFSWLPQTGKKEKMAKAIAAALGERFAVDRVFGRN
jgi:hypothetical protein